MRYTFPTIIVMLACAAAVGIFLVPPGAVGQNRTLEERVAALEKKIDGPAATVPRLAVADLEKIINDCPAMGRLRDELRKYSNEQKNILDVLKTSVEADRRKQQEAPPDSQDWWDWEKSIRPRRLKYEILSKQIMKDILNRDMINIQAVYGQVIAAVEKYAEEKNYSLVMWSPPAISDELWDRAREQGNVNYLVDVRPILYCSEKAVNITEDIIEILKSAARN